MMNGMHNELSELSDKELIDTFKRAHALLHISFF
jgi:hypothetical protein